MTSTAREYFTVDLRGLRAALAACAERDGLTESEVLRSALVVALREGDASPSLDLLDLPPEIRQVKLSVRVSALAAHRLDLERPSCRSVAGAYLMRLIESAPPVIRRPNVLRASRH